MGVTAIPTPTEGPFQKLLSMLGPGLITGASDDDPSGIGTYATVGAALGYGTLWTILFSFPLMTAVQFICAKVGMVSGRGLAGVLRHHYPRGVLYPAVLAVVVANTINAGADLGAIAAGLNLLLPIPIGVAIVPVAAIILALQIWGSYRLIANIFKWLTLVLLAYIVAGFLARPDWGQVLRSAVVPSIRLDAGFLGAVVAILGTTISPYLFFWQASEEVEEEISMGRTRLSQRRGATDDELKYASWDVNVGMFASNLVAFFIIMTTAATLFRAGQNNIQSATQAAQALRPIAGDFAGVVFALGLIGTGFLAVPVLTGSGAYAAAEAFGWRYGLDKHPRKAKHFYGVIVASTVIGLLINYVGINPISALYWTAIMNGVVAPPLLVLIMLVANNRTVMGRRTNGAWTNLLGWLTTLVMFGAVIAMIVTGGGG
jgi:NRAMP (natural resistance-associated macrophage protein)-like metal ion transporter